MSRSVSLTRTTWYSSPLRTRSFVNSICNQNSDIVPATLYTMLLHVPCHAVQYCYKAVIFLQKHLNRHPIGRPRGPDMGVFCEFKVCFKFSLCHCTAVYDYHDTSDRVETAPDCIKTWLHLCIFWYVFLWMTQTGMATDKGRHRCIGEYEFHGVVYHGALPDVHKLLEFDDYRPDDVILTTYPKSVEKLRNRIRELTICFLNVWEI